METFHDGDDCTNEYVTSSNSSGVNEFEKTIAKKDLVSVNLLSSEDEGKQEKEKYEERFRDGKVDNHHQDKIVTDYKIEIIEEINQSQSDDHMTSLSSQSHSDDHMTIVSNQSHNDDHMTFVSYESNDDDHMSPVSNQSPSVDHMTSNELTEEQTDDVSTSYLAKNEIKEKLTRDITSTIVSINQLSQSHEDASSMSRETHTIRNADITSSTSETSSLDLTCDTAEGGNQSTNSRIPNSVASSSSDEKISTNHFKSSHITSSAEHPENVDESDSWNNFSESVQDDNNSQVVNDKLNRTENENEVVSCGSFLAEPLSNKNVPFEEITSDSEIQTTTLDETRTVNDDTDSIENGNRNEAHTFEYVTEGSSKEFSQNNKDNMVDSSTVSPVSFTDEVHSNLGTPEYVETNSNDTASSIGDNIGYFGRNENTFNNIVGNTGCLSIPEDTVGSTLGVISSTSYDITVEAISSDEELEEGEIAEIPNKVSSVDDISVPNNASEHVISSSGLFYPPLDTIPISPPANGSEISSSFREFTTFTITSSEDFELTTQRREAPIQTTGLLSVFPFSSLNIRSASNSNNSSPNPLGFSSCLSTDPIPNMFQPADSTDISMQTPQYEPLSDDDS
ncbi:putative leucine-rich repeat-containing protein DDB_G0290503 [Xenia sp. Carnegie-2017]|uniref:putative leucine-rich repeat-containing protein DDB_G0290503 n=1 Tax=Xenia sp. Carnegie-2017 TaxID=2897299 RepID=UPI001F04E433|nr:putative leucine-rich repeat-containing protein DDB_G0290503 [Xenia sp. Carnegie-2017]